MQIVIDILDIDYETIELFGKFTSHFSVDDITKIIKNGTPLPKGHGRLGDLDALEDFCNGREIGNSLTGEILVTVGHYNDGDEINKKLFSEEIAPTIIPADKAESEG